MVTDFCDVTELSGEKVSSEQIERLCHRYYWAGKYCKDKDVVEVACGTGQGLGYLISGSKSLEAGDYSQAIVDKANAHYNGKIKIEQYDALAMPYSDNSKDVIIIFEAIYYLPDVEKFIDEAARVLRDGGVILIATANKDLYDFNPSPYSYQYLGAVELVELFKRKGFSVDLFGFMPIAEVSWRQRILRPIKRIVVKLGLMPKSMKSKKLLKRLVFGDLVAMPAEITQDMYPYAEPVALGVEADMMHKVIYCAAKKQ